MLSVLHTIGMKTVRQQLHHPPPRVEKTSFLGVERSRVCFWRSFVSHLNPQSVNRIHMRCRVASEDVVTRFIEVFCSYPNSFKLINMQDMHIVTIDICL